MGVSMRSSLFSVLAAVGLIAGCDGGGGSPPEPSGVKVTLSGAAVKGPMARADVGVYAIGADGKPGASALATAETGADGSYTISFDGSKDQPYVVIVKAKAGTTHLDEVSGVAQALPVGFQMRALLIPASAGTLATTATVTPFSELAVAAAEKAEGGISAANARQAESTVMQLLGFDPRAVLAKSTTAAESEDEKKLAVMLAAVSKLASDGSMGCATAPTAGEKTQCVVRALRDSASKDSIRLGSVEGHDAAEELSDAITQVLADDSLKGSVSAATLTALQSNLACTTDCEAAPVSTQPAIAAARKLFTDMATDWKTLFSGGGISAIATGAANAQAFKFSGEFPKLEQPVDTLLADFEALTMGAQLHRDFKAGAPQLTRTSARGRVPSNAPQAFFSLGARACALYQDAATTVQATAPANANFVGCSAYSYARQTIITGGARNTYYRHGFLLTPNADGSFAWEGRARETVDNCLPTCARVVNNNLQLDAAGAGRVFTGRIIPTLVNGEITGLDLTGDLPAAFDQDGFAGGSYRLANDRHGMALKATTATDAATGAFTSMTLTGSFDAKDAAGVTLASLQLKSGQITTIPVGIDSRGNAVAPDAPSALPGLSGFEFGSFALDLLFGTPGARFEGILSASDVAWDKSRTISIPTKAGVTGIFSTLEGATATDFLTLSFTVQATGYANFDATRLADASNRYTQNVSLVGTVTAPGRPLLRLAFGAVVQTNSHGGNAQSATLQYSSVIGGSPRTVIDITASPDPVTGEINRFRLTEATANLSMEWVDGASAVKLMNGSVEIGTLDVDRRLITFKDRTSMSLDIGL